MADIIQIANNEAQVLSRYLIGKDCPDVVAVRYHDALHKLNAQLSSTEQKTWNKMLASVFYLKLIDSGLAISNPQSNLRKRIFIMLAILEVTPDFTEYFLPQERSVFYILPLGFSAGLSAIYLVFGTLTVKLFGIN